MVYGMTVVVPQGKILDYIDGKLRNETPEEYVRQEIEKAVIKEYQYLREEIAIEYRIKMGSASPRVDIAIFGENEIPKQENIATIIECKAATVPPTHKKEGVGQLQSYMAACVNAEFGMWTNGQDRFCYWKKEEDGKIKFIEIPDIPVKGKSLDESERPSFDSLRPATSATLLFAFKRCHNYIAGNQGLQKPEAFWELLKLIFCKIEDERSTEIDFFATTRDLQGLNGHLKVKGRLDSLFHQVIEKHSGIFKSNEIIELEPRVLSYIVSQLQAWSLLDSDIDVKGQAYEEIVGSNLRGDRGEFFTPRNICHMAVEMLDPSSETTVLDPACGTGGFLTIAMNHVIQKIHAAESGKWRDRDNPSEYEQQETFRKIREYANSRIVGIDLNPNLVKASKMNMVMNNDGAGGLFQGNSLVPPIIWNEELQDRALLGSVDLVFTNPPFGSKIPVDDPSILEQYDLAHAWDYDEESDTYQIRIPRQLQKSQPPEILFVERCVQFLKPGRGRMAIVLPDGILGAPGLAYVREWILQQTRVIASVDLHPDTFQPGTSTQTSVLILERKTADEIKLEKAAGKKKDYQVFMALANHIGHDKRGNTIFVRDEEGNEIIMTKEETVWEIQEGKRVARSIKVKQKVIDDNTMQIAAAFRKWLDDQY